MEEINKNLQEALETPNLEELNRYLEESELKLVMSFSNSDLRFVEIYCFIAQLEKEMQKDLEKKIESINKDFEVKLAHVQIDIDDVKTKEALDDAKKNEAEKDAGIREKSEVEGQDKDEKTGKQKVNSSNENAGTGKEGHAAEGIEQDEDSDNLDRDFNEINSPSDSISEADDSAFESQPSLKSKSEMESALRSIRDKVERERIIDSPEYQDAMKNYNQLNQLHLQKNHRQRAIAYLSNLAKADCLELLESIKAHESKDLFKKPINHLYKDENNLLRDRLMMLEDKLKEYQHHEIENVRLTAALNQSDKEIKAKDEQIKKLQETQDSLQLLKLDARELETLKTTNQELQDKFDDLEARHERIVAELNQKEVALKENNKKQIETQQFFENLRKDLEGEKTALNLERNKFEKEKVSFENESERTQDSIDKQKADIDARLKDLAIRESKGTSRTRSNTPVRRPLVNFTNTRDFSQANDTQPFNFNRQSALGIDQSMTQQPLVTREVNELTGKIEERPLLNRSTIAYDSDLTIDQRSQRKEIEAMRREVEEKKKELLSKEANLLKKEEEVKHLPKSLEMAEKEIADLKRKLGYHAGYLQSNSRMGLLREQTLYTLVIGGLCVAVCYLFLTRCNSAV